jgi:nitrite reductase/ring-hydroxylating ferredoxin subunit
VGNESLPPRLAAFLQHVGALMKDVRTESLRTYETKVEAGWVHVAT